MPGAPGAYYAGSSPVRSRAPTCSLCPHTRRARTAAMKRRKAARSTRRPRGRGLTLVQPSTPGASSHGQRSTCCSQKPAVRGGARTRTLERTIKKTISTLMFCASSLAVVSGVYSQRGNMGHRVLAAALASSSSSCCPGKILRARCRHVRGESQGEVAVRRGEVWRGGEGGPGGVEMRRDEVRVEWRRWAEARSGYWVGSHRNSIPAQPRTSPSAAVSVPPWKYEKYFSL